MTDQTLSDRMYQDAVNGRAGVEIAPNLLAWLVPDGHDVKTWNVERAQPFPTAKRGHTVLSDPADFGAWVARHAEPTTTLWVSPDHTGKYQVSVVFDDHEPGDEGLAGWGEHTASLELAVTPDWLRLTAADCRQMSQRDFATLLDDLGGVVVNPPAGDLAELVDTLHATTNTKVGAAGFSSNGGTTLTFEQAVTIRGGKKTGVEFPARVVFEVQPFKAVPFAARVEARLHVTAEPGDHPKISYRLRRPDEAFAAAVDAAVEIIMSGLNGTVPVFHGAAGEGRGLL